MTRSPTFSERAFQPLRASIVAPSGTSTVQFAAGAGSRALRTKRTRGLIHSTLVTVPRSVTRRALSYVASLGSAPEFDEADVESTRMSLIGVFVDPCVQVPFIVREADPISLTRPSMEIRSLP